MSGMLSSEQGLRMRDSMASNQTVGAESSSPLLNPSGSSGPSLQRDLSSVGGAVRVLSGQRPRHQQKKHPEPLRRAVADCLSCSPHASASIFPTEAVRTVQDYLANSVTVDSAYSVLIDHALAERGRSPPVITKCVSLLKKYLFRYYPRPATLWQIDAFCVGIIAECNAEPATKKSIAWIQPASDSSGLRVRGLPSGLTTSSASTALVKSLNFVRALVQRHLPCGEDGSSGHSKPLTPAAMVSPWPGGLKRGLAEDQDDTNTVARGFTGLDETKDEDVDYIAVNVLMWRWAGPSGQLAWTPSPVMTDSGGIGRPHVERMPHLADQGAAALTLRGMDRKEMGSITRKQGDKSKPPIGEVGGTEQLLRPSVMTTVTDHVATRSHLRAIAAAKRKNHPSQRWDGEGAAGTVRRRARPLFQYRHYSEQQPLKLSKAEMEEVVSAVCAEAAASGSTGLTPVQGSNQSGKLGVEAADVAASVLIKLLIDMYIADSRTAAPLTLSLLQGMLASREAAVRVRAFDLVLNLCVHAHLLEPMQSEDQASVEESSQPSPLTGGSFSSVLSAGDFPVGERERTFQENGKGKGLSETPERGTQAAVGVFEAWLLDIVCEMLLYLVQSEELEEGVWAAALSCLLYLVCDRGRIRRQRLNGLDIRVLSSLLEVSWMHAWAEEVHSRLVRMACSLLYRQAAGAGELNSKPSLDLEQLYLMGGVETICSEYSRAKTGETKCNLFAVLLDYVLQGLIQASRTSGKQPPSLEEIQGVVSSLTLAEAPESFSLAFKQGLQGVGESIAKSIVTAMARDVTNGRLNAQLLEDIMASLDLLASAYMHPDPSFEHLIKVTMISEGLSSPDVSGSGLVSRDRPLDPALVTKAWATLRKLLHSSNPLCRSNGYAWLLELLSAEMAHGGSKQASKLNTYALQRQLSLLGRLERATELDFTDKMSETPTISSAARLLCGLLKAKEPVIRRGFVLVLEKLLLHCQRPGLELENLLPFAVDGEPKDGSRSMGVQDRALAMLGLMNGALWQVISANDTDRINILQMCNMMFSQLCVKCPQPEVSSPPGKQTVSGGIEMSSISDNTKGQETLVPDYRRLLNGNMISNNLINMNGNFISLYNNGQDCSMAAMLLNGQAAAPVSLVANMPTALLYWPLMQLASSANEDVALGVAVGSRGGGSIQGGACDVRAALLLLLIGKCSTYQAALDEVGGEEFFRGLLDDSDARIAYYTSAFLLKRMMREEPEAYQRMLQNLVFKAQQWLTNLWGGLETEQQRKAIGKSVFANAGYPPVIQ